MTDELYLWIFPTLLALSSISERLKDVFRKEFPASGLIRIQFLLIRDMDPLAIIMELARQVI